MEFKSTKKEEAQNIIKKNFSNEFFVVDYSHLLSNPTSLESTKKSDITYNKKLGYDVLGAQELEKINVIPGFKSGLHDLTNRVLQGVALVFVSECYEPFRIFDTEKEQEEFVEKQKKNDIRDYDIKDFLVKGGYYQRGRHFMDEWRHVQHIDGNMKIAERQSYGDVIHLKGKNGVSYVKKMDVELYHFSLKSLNAALDFLIKNKKQSGKSGITINKDNEKNNTAVTQIN